MIDNSIMKFTNLLFWVQENHISTKFYKKLGFEVIHNEDTHSIVRLGNLEITLVNIRDETIFAHDSMNSEKGKGMYIYIRTENVDKLYNKLCDKSMRTATKPKDWDWGNREFILKDPDGYKLCFWQPIENQVA